MPLMEVKDELTTEITSEVDIMLDCHPFGFTVSVFIDDEDFTGESTWEQMAEDIVRDIKDRLLDGDEIDDFIGGLQHLLDEIKYATGRE